MRVTFFICFVFALSSVACGQDDTVTLLGALQHADGTIRSAAAARLIESDQAAVLGLLDTVKRRSETHAARAAFVLTQIEHAPGAKWPELVAVLADHEAEPWRWSLAAHLLLRLSTNLGQDAVVSAALQALSRSEQPMKRYAAIKLVYYMGRDGMGRRADAAARQLAHLVSSFKGTYSEVPIAESSIRNRQTGRVVHIAVYADPRGDQTPQRYFTADQLILAAAQRTADPDDHDLWHALRLHLAKLCRTGVATVKLDAATQLVKLNSPEQAIPTLVKLLQPWEKDEIREVAARVLGSLGAVASPTIPDLVKLLNSEEPALRQAGAIAVQKIVSAIDSDLPRQTSVLAVAKSSLDQAILFEQLRPGETTTRTTSSADSPLDELLGLEPLTNNRTRPLDVPAALAAAQAAVQQALDIGDRRHESSRGASPSR